MTNPPASESRETARIEALSDGVFAIVITLLAFELRVPEVGESESLLQALLANWPIYFAFLTSFANIAIIWMNHHKFFKIIARADHGFNIYNVLLLLCVTLIPFTSLTLAEYIQHRDQNIAAMLYTGLFALTGVCFNLLWWHVVHHPHLLNNPLYADVMRTMTRQYLMGTGLYVVAFVIALFSTPLSLLVCVGLAIFFALPQASQPTHNDTSPHEDAIGNQ